MDKDNECVQSYLNGDNEALELLYLKYQPKLYNFIVRLLRDSIKAEDVVQDSFLRAEMNFGKYSIGGNFNAWIFRIAHNYCMNIKRDEKRHMRINEYVDLEDLFGDRFEGSLELVLRKDFWDKNLEGLSQIYKEVLVMHYYRDLKLQEIANELNVPIKTVMTRVYRARKAFSKNFSL